ncbi:MAG: hypothetical protein LBU94_02745, partial [Clostridiales bacterium]|nr:hypothetical protein [Clostridiales bacterium]
MRNIRFCTILLTAVILLGLAGCSGNTVSLDSTVTDADSTEQIFLYGEVHAVDKILEKEFEIWKGYYDSGMRHLFIEYPYYTAEFFNIWMKGDSDDILNQLYEENEGTSAHSPNVKEFFMKIKAECPETIFHGTDVGHMYGTTGYRFLRYLEENGLKDTEQYLLAEECIDQGRRFYGDVNNNLYREEKMTENFIREFDKLSGESIMGIYGSAHTGVDAFTFGAPDEPCMANRLKERYGETLFSEDLSSLAYESRVETITVNGKDYQATYFGEQNVTGRIADYATREFW